MNPKKDYYKSIINTQKMISFTNFKDKRFFNKSHLSTRERFPTKSLETSSITIVQINNPSQSIGYTSTDREIYTPPPSPPFALPTPKSTIHRDTAQYNKANASNASI